MLSESSQTGGESFSGHLSRSRRLADVKRGTIYTRAVDSLAERQWYSHGGVPLTSRTVVSPTFHVSSYLRERPDFPVNQDSTMLPLVSRSLHSPLTNSETTDSNYNTWGSRNSDLDSKLEPETKPSVVLPKRGVMMSRVARNNQEREFKTMTNFRSRNGTIRIIKPVSPQPQFNNTENGKIDGQYDPVSLEREQTYIMLKRIDQILHPAKTYFKSDLSSSEIEVLSGESIHSGDTIEHLQPRSAIGRTDDASRRPRKEKFCKTGTSGQSLTLVVNRLAKRELNAYQKCQIWIDSCSKIGPIAIYK